MGGRCYPLLINDPRFAPAGVLAPKSQGRSCLHYAHAQLAGGQWYGGDRRISGGAVPGRRRAKIRKYLIDNNYVDAVIQLPPDLFFGTTIATCVIVLKKPQVR